MLEARSVSKVVGKRLILSSVDLELKSRESVVVVGPSGSGKTSLLRALAGLDRGATGDILLDGRRLSEIPREQLWPRVTMVFQQLFLWPHLTLLENLRLPVAGTELEEGVGKRIHQVCARLGLLERQEQYPNELSLGERQRAALARALLVRPRYLLLDEISSALDVESARAVVALLNELKVEEQVGLLIVTHHLGLAKRLADKVLFLDRGSVVERGGAEILERPKTARLEQFLSVA